ncbi:MAG: hypothetical protein QGH51_08920 [Planctomycetota bacterium]|jgi:hypothetical protein|nr:hypothetical protein [Planctomycetota bacterium]MDP6942131.1 hypothetical protein [Planctomycetota bacterium]
MTILSISFLCMTLVQTPVSSFPHPSKPIYPQTYDRCFEPGGNIFVEGPDLFWERLAPTWLEDDELGRELQGLDALSEHLAQTHSWSVSAQDAWKSIAASDAVMATCSLVDGKGQVLFAGNSPLLSGVPVRFGDTAALSKVYDFDVEVAQESSLADPVVRYLVQGRTLSLRAFGIAEAGWQVELAYVDTQASPVEYISMGANSMKGGVERLEREVTEYGSTIFLRPGEEEVLSLPASNGEELFLHIQLDGAVPRIASTQDGTFFLGVPSLAAQNQFPAYISDLRKKGPVWSHESGWLAFDGESAEQLARRSAADAMAAAPQQRHTIQMRIFEDGMLAKDEKVDAFLAPGMSVRFVQGVAAQALSDWDVEIACSARIPDPIFRPLFGGIAGSVEMQKDGRLALDCVLSSISIGEPVSMLIAPQVASLNGHEGPSPAQPSIRVAVENPTQGSTGFRGTYPLDSDGNLKLSQTWTDAADSKLRSIELEIQRSN